MKIVLIFLIIGFVVLLQKPEKGERNSDNKDVDFYNPDLLPIINMWVEAP